jgi:uncharacterized protein (DUF4415 family)
MTTMSLKDMRAARERGESKSDPDRVRRMVRDGVEPAEDDDSPNAGALMRAEIEKRRRGRPAGSGTKVQVSIRYHREVVDYFKSTGEGWQTRMDDALMEWVKTHSHSA